MSEKELKEQVAALTRQVAALTAKLEPPKSYVSGPSPNPHRCLDLVSMPPEAMRDLVNGVRASVMADLRADATRRSVLQPASDGRPNSRPDPIDRSGWREAIPSGPTPNARRIDIMVESAGLSQEQIQAAMERAKQSLAEEDAGSGVACGKDKRSE